MTSNPASQPDSIFSFVQNRDFYSLFFQLYLRVLCTAYHDHYAVSMVMTGSTRHFSFISACEINFLIPPVINV